MSVSVQYEHQQLRASTSSSGLRRESTRANVAAGSLAPPQPGHVERAELDLSRRRRPTQTKRGIITNVACQPCQRRKYKCDGQRLVCTPCLVRRRSDCVYDATADKRRTTALKARIQHLSKQAEDLEDIVRGIAAASDPGVAFATVRQLVAEGFAQAADTDGALATNGATANGSTALYMYAPSIDETFVNHVDPGGVSFSPWQFQVQNEPLEFVQSDYENTPIEFSGHYWPSDDQTNFGFQPTAQETQGDEYKATAGSEHASQDSELWQSESVFFDAE
ncbi:hypothetical protein GTA08_BOTSDO13985 [Botryosphaeria dothidea]|uniref:Zn(2)-C6 fungal-type domain-containing protein n=1 Tax=Botryosphaeria dothidea TaxID=55169 RepID=A0A8H4IZL4_9PEZI|nr:hypothetical protein GTA08_BOTSDO13985 [Botryosphaeria dothidea]